MCLACSFESCTPTGLHVRLALAKMRASCFTQQSPISSYGAPKTRRVLARAEATRWVLCVPLHPMHTRSLQLRSSNSDRISDGLCCLPGYRLDHPDHRTVATHVSLDSLSVHKLQPGHYVAPLLCSGHTSLPFAIGLELFSSTCHDDTEEAGDVLLPELPESEGLLSLQYILDGRAQVVSSR